MTKDEERDVAGGKPIRNQVNTIYASSHQFLMMVVKQTCLMIVLTHSGRTLGVMKIIELCKRLPLKITRNDQSEG